MGKAYTPNIKSDKGKNLTKYVAEFVKKNKYSTIPKNVVITYNSLNDQTVEGLKCTDVPAFSVQYHPESSPGPHDSRYLFEEFIKLMSEIEYA